MVEASRALYEMRRVTDTYERPCYKVMHYGKLTLDLSQSANDILL